MTRRTTARRTVPVALALFWSACAPEPGPRASASDGYAISINFELDANGQCIDRIVAEPWVREIRCRHHAHWCQGDDSAPPRVTWAVAEVRDDYDWKIEHKPDSLTGGERPHFPDEKRFHERVTVEAGANKPPLLDQGLSLWTYNVRAVPLAGNACEPVSIDPQIIFNGGGGGGYSPRLWWTYVPWAIAGLALLLVWNWLRRRRTPSWD